MDKKEFMEKLSHSLRGITKEERNDIMSDFEEHFEAGKSEGRSEEDLAKSLGDPIMLARQLRASSLLEKAEKDTSATNITRAVFASLGLGFFNLIFILGPFAVIAALLASLFAAAVGITAAGITGFFGSIFSPLFPQYFNEIINPAVGIFGSIGVACFGLLFFVGDIFLVKALYRLFIRYIRFNTSIITGRKVRKDEI